MIINFLNLEMTQMHLNLLPSYLAQLLKADPGEEQSQQPKQGFSQASSGALLNGDFGLCRPVVLCSVRHSL